MQSFTTKKKQKKLRQQLSNRGSPGK